MCMCVCVRACVCVCVCVCRRTPAVCVGLPSLTSPQTRSVAPRLLQCGRYSAPPGGAFSASTRRGSIMDFSLFSPPVDQTPCIVTEWPSAFNEAPAVDADSELALCLAERRSQSVSSPPLGLIWCPHTRTSSILCFLEFPRSRGDILWNCKRTKMVSSRASMRLRVFQNLKGNAC